MGVLKVKDPADPSGASWINIVGAGPMGPTGPSVTGPTGATGPAGAGAAPPGGTADQPLVKVSNVDGDVRWGGNLHMGTGDITFNNDEGDKIYVYPGATPGSTSYGLGIAASTLAIFAGSASTKIAFREGGHDGTEWGYVNPSGFYHGGTKLQRQILQNGGFQGPWDGEGTAAWTVNLTAGAYIFMFGASGLSTTVGARTIDLKVDGTIEATARIWTNTVNAHTAFNAGIGTGSYSAGNHTITIHNGGNTTSDVNDYGWVLCIPS